MAYVPRQRRYKVRWKVVAPLLVLIALIVYLLIGMFLPSNHQEVKKFTVCGLNEEQTIKHCIRQVKKRLAFRIICIMENLWICMKRNIHRKIKIR